MRPKTCGACEHYYHGLCSELEMRWVIKHDPPPTWCPLPPNVNLSEGGWAMLDFLEDIEGMVERGEWLPFFVDFPEIKGDGRGVRAAQKVMGEE